MYTYEDDSLVPDRLTTFLVEHPLEIQQEKREGAITYHFSRAGYTLTIDLSIKDAPNPVQALTILLNYAYLVDREFEPTTRAQRFFWFCSEYGWNWESTKAREAWKNYLIWTRWVRRLFGEDYQAFLDLKKNEFGEDDDA